MAVTACEQAMVRSLNMLAARFAMLAAKREAEETVGVRCGQEQSEISKLIAMMEQATADQPDPVRALADTIRLILEGEADPYLVVGVLIEGAVHAVRTSIPPERQDEIAAAMLKLLQDRLEQSTGR